MGSVLGAYAVFSPQRFALPCYPGAKASQLYEHSFDIHVLGFRD